MAQDNIKIAIRSGKCICHPKRRQASLAGPLDIASSTTSFLLGFVAAAIIVGWAADRGLANWPLALFGTMLADDLVKVAIATVAVTGLSRRIPRQ